MITKDACRSMVLVSDIYIYRNIYEIFVDTIECVLMTELICFICFSAFVLSKCHVSYSDILHLCKTSFFF